MKKNKFARVFYKDVEEGSEDILASIELDLYVKLTRRMHELGISQRSLSERLGISQPTISRILNHDYKPTLALLVDLAYALDFRMRLVLEDLEERKEE